MNSGHVTVVSAKESRVRRAANRSTSLLCALALVALVAAACRGGDTVPRQEAAAPTEVATPVPLGLEFIGWGSPGQTGAGTGLQPGYRFRLQGITTAELRELFTVCSRDALVQRPPGTLTLVDPDILSVRLDRDRVPGHFEVALNLPDGRSTRAGFDVPLVSYSLPDDLPTSQQQAIRDGVAIAERYAARELGAALTHPIGVWATGDDSALALADVNDRVIRIFVRRSAWPRIGTAAQRQVVAHEFVHLLQEDLSEHWAGPPGPVWLTEGSAEMLSYRAVAAESGANYEVALACWTSIAQTAGTPALEDLPYLRDVDLLTPPYVLGALATDRLAADTGVASLMTFYRLARTGDWHDAFTQAFGRDLNTFYAEFAEYRASLAKPAAAACR